MKRATPVLCAAALVLFLADAPTWGGSADIRSSASSRTFVSPAPCDDQAPCPSGYWVFRPSNCQDGDLTHPPGTVVLFGDETTLQCRCRLTWLRTKRGVPPTAKVSCMWIDLDEVRARD